MRIGIATDHGGFGKDQERLAIAQKWLAQRYNQPGFEVWPSSSWGEARGVFPKFVA